MKPDYKETVLAYKDMVYRIAFAQCPCRQDAEDVFQEVFFKLYSFNGDFSDEEHVKSWLIRVTLNCCKLIKRSAWFKKRAELTEDIPAETENAEDSETAAAVTAAVRSLPEKYRPIVMMYYYEEMSCDEIAAALKLNGGTVRTRLKRAREKLKKELEVFQDE